MKIEGIKSEDELEKAQAAAQAQNKSITNYQEWSDILSLFEENGIESTGSYSGDVAKMNEIQQAVEEYVQEMQVEEKSQPKNDETQKVQEVTETDKEQEIKSNVANATSADIMADYMKYYHLL